MLILGVKRIFQVRKSLRKLVKNPQILVPNPKKWEVAYDYTITLQY